MKRSTQIRNAILGFLAIAFVPGFSANAAMISTNQAVSRMAMDAERQKIAEFVNREDVKSQLIGYGVNPAEAATRLASLSDQEVQKLSKQIDSATAAGEPIFGILSLVLIVLLIIYLAQRI